MRKLVSVMLALVMVLGVTACGKRDAVTNDEMELEIHIGNFGYGIDWLQPMIDVFLEEDWVKEKYPGLTIPRPKTNSERSFGVDRTLAGTVNTIDLFITATVPNYNLSSEYRPGEKYFAELSDVYNSTVPGEDILYKDKMLPDFVTRNTYTDRVGNKSFYTTPWVVGMHGMLYNQTAFDEMELTVPRTTDELSELCDTIVEKGEIPFVFSTSTGYWTSMDLLIWWAQYEGIDAYNMYYEGKQESVFEGEWELSRNVVQQKGRLRALEVLESLIESKDGKYNPNVHPESNTLNFTQAQTYFLQRDGLMTPNADWFASEMADVASEGITDTFLMMRVPIISAIREKTPSITDDATLREVVDAIDAGLTSYAGVTDEDFTTVAEARRIVFPTTHHTCFIPTYATAKEPAKDFLRFMATDKAQKIFMQYTLGARLAFDYDVQTDAPEVYENLSPIHKSRIEMEKNSRYMCDAEMISFCYLGGFGRFNSQSPNTIESLFTTLNPAEKKTAQQIYDEEIKFWDATRWTNVLTRAGLSA